MRQTPHPRQRLLLHGANLDTGAGRRALLSCIEINKLEGLAVGGCTGIKEDTTKEDSGGGGGDKKTPWWETFCHAIRESGFNLQELTVEGLERGK